MSIARNEIHVNTVKCWDALQAHQHLLAFMQAPLRAALEAQVNKIRPALQTVSHVDKKAQEALAEAEKTLDKSHEMILHLHEGVKYCYREHADQMRTFIPVKLGADIAENSVRLALLERELPKAVPAFLWLPGDGLTHAALKKQLDADTKAAKVEASLGPVVRDAFKLLRDQRPASHQLWDKEGFGLDGWVGLNVPKDQQYAFGRERRQRPRPAKSADTKTKGDAKGTGETPPNNGPSQTTSTAPGGAAEPAQDGALAPDAKAPPSAGQAGTNPSAPPEKKSA